MHGNDVEKLVWRKITTYNKKEEEN